MKKFISEGVLLGDDVGIAEVMMRMVVLKEEYPLALYFLSITFDRSFPFLSSYYYYYYYYYCYYYYCYYYFLVPRTVSHVAKDHPIFVAVIASPIVRHCLCTVSHRVSHGFVLLVKLPPIFIQFSPSNERQTCTRLAAWPHIGGHVKLLSLTTVETADVQELTLRNM